MIYVRKWTPNSASRCIFEYLFSPSLSTQRLVHFIGLMAHSSHPPIYKLLILLLQLVRFLFGDVDLQIQRDHLVLDILEIISSHLGQHIKTSLTSINLAFPLNSSSRSLTF